MRSFHGCDEGFQVRTQGIEKEFDVVRALCDTGVNELASSLGTVDERLWGKSWGPAEGSAVYGTGCASSTNVGFARHLTCGERRVGEGSHVQGSGDAILYHGVEIRTRCDMAVGVDEAWEQITAAAVHDICPKGIGIRD